MKPERIQTARKSTNPKLKVNEIKKVKFRPDSFNRPFLKPNELEIDWKRFAYLVNEILEEMNLDFQFQGSAISILQEAAENYLVNIFENINRQNRNGEKIGLKDFLSVTEPSVENAEPTAVLSSYKVFLSACNTDKAELKVIDDDVERLFLVFWGNKAYERAMDLLISLDEGIPSEQILVILFQFMIQKNHGNNGIYDYILNIIINQPPKDEKIILYYKNVFAEIATNIFENVQRFNKQGVIDTLYLASIHDYLLMNLTCSKKDCYTNCLVYDGSNSEYSHVFKTILKSSKSIPLKSWQRLYEIISFCDESFVNESTRYFTRIKLFMEKSSQKTFKFSNFEEFYNFFFSSNGESTIL